MIDQCFQQECHIFLCYRGESAEIAKNFKKGLANIKDRFFGYVWYSDQENVGNFTMDIPRLIPTARYAVIFFSENFTKDFLIDGNNNYGDTQSGDVGCVTVREIVEIERCRQAGMLTVIGVHLGGYTLTHKDIAVLQQVFKNEGILTPSSIAAYTELNINAYYPRTTDVDVFAQALSRGLEKQKSQKNQKTTKVNTDQLLPPISHQYYGRETLFSQAEAAAASKSCLNITGPVGSGKSAFVFHWLAKMAATQYYGAEYVFYWSFSQDEDDTAISSDLSSFLESALTFFEIDRLENGSGEAEKAAALSRFLENHSVILILDGIDTFLNCDQTQKGMLANQMIKRIVNTATRSATAGNGLLVLLSTCPIADLQYYPDKAQTLLLSELSEADCVRILLDLGVVGDDGDMRDAVRELNHDPLSITLLGKLLVSHYHGNIKERYRVDYASENAQQAAPILSFYQKLWPSSSKEGMILLLCSLFRYGIHRESILSLLEKLKDVPAFSAIRAEDVTAALQTFQKAGLLHGEYRLSLLPLVREQYRRQFRSQTPDIYCRCNYILGDLYSRLCNDDTVSTIADISPLYDAVFYYIQANEPEAAVSLLWNRIFRKRTFFSQKQLGAATNDLYAISLFFDVRDDWKPHHRLSLVDAAWLSSAAAYLQNNIGNLAESERLRRRELEIYQSLSHHLFLASDGQNLARNLMLQGKLAESEQAFLDALQALKQAEGKIFEKNPYSDEIDTEQLETNILTRYAYLLYLRGQAYWDKANELLQSLSPEQLRESTTGAFYYWYVRLHTASPSKRHKVCKEIEKEYLLFVNQRKKHETAYAGLLLAQTTWIAAAPLGRNKAVKTCLHNINHAIRDAKAANRMDQLPFLLNEALKLYLRLLQEGRGAGRKAELLAAAEAVIRDLDEIFSLYELPVYRLEYLFLKAQYFVRTENREAAVRLYDEVRQSPTCIQYFADKIQDLRHMLEE